MTVQNTRSLESRLLVRNKRNWLRLLTMLGLSLVINGILAVHWLLLSYAPFPGTTIDTRVIGGTVIVILSGLLAFHFYQQKRSAEIILHFLESQAAGSRIEAELAQATPPKMQSR